MRYSKPQETRKARLLCIIPGKQVYAIAIFISRAIHFGPRSDYSDKLSVPGGTTDTARKAMFGVLEAARPQSELFATCEDLMRDLNMRAEKEGYKIVKARSHRSRPGAPIVRADLVCERGGRPYRCQATKHRTSTKKTNCPWKAKAVNRKVIGGWILTVMCDHHNHEPGTPEPPTPSENGDAAETEGAVEKLDHTAHARTPPDVHDRPAQDINHEELSQHISGQQETATALQVAGVTDPVLRLSGETFHRLKGEYRKLSQPERLSLLAQMQLRIAALYAVQNEDVLRQSRFDAQDKRQQAMGATRPSEPQHLQSVKRQRAPRRSQQETAAEETPGLMSPGHANSESLPLSSGLGPDQLAPVPSFHPPDPAAQANEARFELQPGVSVAPDSQETSQVQGNI